MVERAKSAGIIFVIILLILAISGHAATASSLVGALMDVVSTAFKGVADMTKAVFN